MGRVLECGVFLLLVVVYSAAQAQKEFPWRDASQTPHTRPELEKILEENRQWVDSGKKLGTRADLSGADLIDMGLVGADLRDANLTGANLTQANLAYAKLTHADLTEATAYYGLRLTHADLTYAILTKAALFQAKLTDADLTGATVIHATLGGADLTHANLTDANLTHANLTDADLTGANLTQADLTHANLTDAELSGVWLGGGNLDGAIFEPKSLPQLRGISAASNLELLTYIENPDTLVQLRKQFVDGGFRDQERKITYALKRREAELSWVRCTSRGDLPKDRTRAIVWSSDSVLANFASFVLNKVFFDWTCQYGMSPGRPLILGLVLWFLCSLLYFAGIHAPGDSGLYRVYARGICDDQSAPERVERIAPTNIPQTRTPRWLLHPLWRELLLLRTSMFFSLMSAFNIGFRDINFGRWLRLLTREEFDIKAVGWARVVAGWQSLLSVFLIALWVLTYFGRPFG
jgi:uncharacterized protein YjbI with pentapeptide repeats